MKFEYLKSKLERVPSIAIEDLVTQIWNHYGYTVNRSQESRDSGADVVATRTQPYPRKEVIRIEHRGRDSAPVGSSLIQQASALPKQEGADDVILVVTSTLTTDAESLARDLDVIVVDFDQLCSTIDSANLYSTVSEFVEVHDSRNQQLHLETLADRITANTAVDSGEPVYKELVDIFSEHNSSPRIEKNTTIDAFSESDPRHAWQHSTTINWSTKPNVDADEIANQLAEGLSERNSSEIEAFVLSSVIQSELGENLGTPLEEASIPELAEWYIDDFGEEEVPLAGRDRSLAIDIAEDVIDLDESVASNKLRVAEKLNFRYDQRHEVA